MIREYIYFVDDNPNGTSGMTEEEVVRCRDCDRGFSSPVCPIQSQGWAINKNTFYCAWGERSE